MCKGIKALQRIYDHAKYYLESEASHYLPEIEQDKNTIEKELKVLEFIKENIMFFFSEHNLRIYTSENELHVDGDEFDLMKEVFGND